MRLIHYINESKEWIELSLIDKPPMLGCFIGILFVISATQIAIRQHFQAHASTCKRGSCYCVLDVRPSQVL